MRRILFYLISLTLVALGSCGKFTSKKHYTLDPDFKVFFNYHDGSQWKYVLESDTNIVEIVSVVNHKEGRMDWDAFDQEFFEYDLLSDRDSNCKLRAIADENKVTRAAFFRKDTGVYHLALEWYFSDGSYHSSGGTGDSVRVLPQKIVNGRLYTNVLEIVPADHSRYNRMYIARNVGIVRKELANGKVYLLKSYSLL